MLLAAREAWEAQGYHVHGAALAGKAAEGLEELSGIASRTLASWECGWQNGRDELGTGDVLVIDEAGMVSSRQLARFVGEAERAGRQDRSCRGSRQLQPIQAGAAFRAIAERVGFAELEGVRRQGEDWQRAASVAFARHRTEEGLSAYAERGAVRLEETREEARAEIVRDVMADMRGAPGGSRIVLAHLRVDVRELNEAIRAARQERGELAGERAYATNDGERKFAAGDRILFLENNRELAVKNGMLGTVEKADDGRLSVRLDSAKGSRARARSLRFDWRLRRGRSRLCDDHPQGAGGDRRSGLCAGLRDDGPASRRCGDDAPSRERDALRREGRSFGTLGRCRRGCRGRGPRRRRSTIRGTMPNGGASRRGAKSSSRNRSGRTSIRVSRRRQERRRGRRRPEETQHVRRARPSGRPFASVDAKGSARAAVQRPAMEHAASEARRFLTGGRRFRPRLPGRGADAGGKSPRARASKAGARQSRGSFGGGAARIDA